MPIETDIPEQDGGTLINVLNYQTPLPAAYWGTTCGLNCLDSVVKDVMDDGFTHHIPRLMVLANIATLLEIRPREITDWFWVSFIDAFDWVVEPNVLAMGTLQLEKFYLQSLTSQVLATSKRCPTSVKDAPFIPRRTAPSRDSIGSI